MSRRRNRAKSGQEPVSRRKEFRRDFRIANAKFLAKIFIFFGVMAALLLAVALTIASMEPHVQVIGLAANNPKSTWQVSANQPSPTDLEAEPRTISFFRDEDGKVQVVPQPDPEARIVFAGNDGSLVLFAGLKTAVLKTAAGKKIPVVSLAIPDSEDQAKRMTPIEQLASDTLASSTDWASFEEMLDAVVEFSLDKNTTLFPINFSRWKRRHLIFACDVFDVESISAFPNTADGFVVHAQEVFDSKKDEWAKNDTINNLDFSLWLSHSNCQRSNLMGQSSGFRSIFRHHFETGIRFEADNEEGTGNGDGYIFYNELKDYIETSVEVVARGMKSIQTPVFLSTSDDNYIVTKVETDLEIRDKPIFFPLSRQPVDELDQLWKSLAEVEEFILLDSPSEFQRATIMLTRMERLWAEGLSTEKKGDAYSNKEFSDLEDEVNRIVQLFQNRYSKNDYSLAVRTATYQYRQPEELCTSLWESQFQFLVNQREKFDLGIFDPIDQKIDEEEFDADATEAEKEKKRVKILDARKIERDTRIEAGWTAVESKPQIGSIVWLALIDPAQKKYLTQETFSQLITGLGIKIRNGKNRLHWSELAYLERLTKEIDWAVFSSGNRLDESQDIIHLSMSARSQANQFLATLNPIFAEGFENQFRQLEFQRRILEDRLFSNDTRSLKSDFEKLSNSYSTLLANYNQFRTRFLAQRKNLVLAPHLLNYCIDNWITDFYRGEDKVNAREQQFVDACENFLGAWAALEMFSPSESLGSDFSPEKSSRLDELNQDFRSATTSFDGFGVSPEVHLEYVGNDDRSKDAENFSKSMLLIRSPHLSPQARSRLRSQILEDDGSVTPAKDAVQSIKDINPLIETITAIQRLQLAQGRFEPIHAGLSSRATMLKELENRGDSLVDQHLTLAASHNYFEPNPQFYLARDRDLLLFAKNQMRHQQLCHDRIVLDLWATPRPRTDYFVEAARIVRKRNAEFGKTEIAARTLNDLVEIGLDNSALEAANRFVEQFRTRWEFTPTTAQSEAKTFSLRFRVDDLAPDFGEAVSAWSRNSDSRQKRVMRTWQMEPMVQNRNFYDYESSANSPAAMPFNIFLRGHRKKIEIPNGRLKNDAPVELTTNTVSHSVRDIPSASIRVQREAPPVRANIVLVLDCSKSMLDGIPSGIVPEGGTAKDTRPKYQIAVKSIEEFIKEIAGEKCFRLEMLAFGATHNYEVFETGRILKNGKPEKMVFERSRILKLNKDYAKHWKLMDRKPEANLVELDISSSGKMVNQENVEEFKEALSTLEFVGQTPLFLSIDKGLDALKAGFDRTGDSENVENILIVISDGVDNTYSNKKAFKNSLKGDGTRAAGYLQTRIKEDKAKLFYFNFGREVDDFSGMNPGDVKSRLELMDSFKDLGEEFFSQSNLREKTLLRFLQEIVAPPNLTVNSKFGKKGPWVFTPYADRPSLLKYSNNQDAINFEREFLGERVSLLLRQGKREIELKTDHGRDVPLYSGLNLNFTFNQSDRTLTTRFAPAMVAAQNSPFRKYGSQVYPNQQTVILSSDNGVLDVQFCNPTNFTVPPKFVVLQIQDENRRKKPILVSDYEFGAGAGDNISLFSFSSLRDDCRRLFGLNGMANFKMFVFEKNIDELWNQRVTGDELKKRRMEFEFDNEFNVLASVKVNQNESTATVTFQVVARESTDFDPEQVIIQPILPNGQIDFDSLLAQNIDQNTVERTRHVDSEGQVKKILHVFTIPNEKLSDPEFSFGMLNFKPGKLSITPAIYESKQRFGLR